MTVLAEWAARPSRAAPILPPPSPKPPLLRNCADCGVCFELNYPTALYCGDACRDRTALTRRAAKRVLARGGTAGEGHVCPDCGATFPGGNALGGHRSRVHTARPPAQPKPPRRPKLDHNTHPCRDCGEPCTSQSQLDAHRGRHHRAKGTIPPTVRVLASLTFVCGDCGRVYDDSNRLTHHRRELHDPPHRAAHEVVVGPRLLTWGIA